MSTPQTLRAKLVAPDSLILHPENPRRGSVDHIVESLRYHGQYRPLVVSVRTRHVLAGNHTLEAARRLGWKRISVVEIDVDEDDERRILAVDNRLNEIGGNDRTELIALLTQLDTLDGTGYDDVDLQRLVEKIPEPEIVSFTAAGISTDTTCPKCGFAWQA